ncbi:polysaccharide pyruvyl transferase family protein [Aurantimonas endophytica]|uniref:Polysaccharide pyruvyl transferase WcaK-like protein n=1 Tax=Aurantimonas endophytica TaxID=1522175 RepID=A0A7W6HGK6_9HYPH|nr:polysaccharide pyruvyl transferase WcaK-like protein [Aurantimonas endophytica]MCO6405606.1 polysaccharide pyruvyl transferase family protein [Aurantimonas endophytica]
MTHDAMRIRLFNVKYSPNLGDGLLSESLENALWELGCSPSGTYSVDLAARSSYGPGGASRGALLRFLTGLPPAVRRTALRLPMAALMHRRWRPHYERHLDSADAVVLGGGNLFSDIDLNFPSKLAQALSLAAARKLPVAIYGVGVSGDWSETGIRMVGKALSGASIRHVTVRDEPSRERFNTLFAQKAGMQAELARDPGLLVSRYVSPVERTGGTVGLGVTSAIAVRYHSSYDAGDDALAEWYLAICRGIAGSGQKIVAFTNGSPEDESFLNAIDGRLAAAAGESYSRRRPTTPTELARLISSFDCLVAHRMHALIAAYSFGVPSFALRWDPKVDAFMASVGASEQMAVAEAGTEDQVIEFARRQNMPETAEAADARERVIAEAFQPVSLLLEALKR